MPNEPAQRIEEWIKGKWVTKIDTSFSNWCNEFWEVCDKKAAAPSTMQLNWYYNNAYLPTEAVANLVEKKLKAA